MKFAICCKAVNADQSTQRANQHNDHLLYCLEPYSGTRFKLAQNRSFNNNGSLSPTLLHLHLTNKEVEVMTEINFCMQIMSI